MKSLENKGKKMTEHKFVPSSGGLTFKHKNSPQTLVNTEKNAFLSLQNLSLQMVLVDPCKH